MKKCVLKSLLGVTLCLSLLHGNAQSVSSVPATFIDNIGPTSRVFSTVRASGKTSSCGTDTLMYAYYKTTAFNSVSLNSASASSFGQWYPAPQPITVYGFDFYAWMNNPSTPLATVALTCNLYLAGTDSMPTGTPVRSVTVTVDSSFGGGLLSVLKKKAIFATPVTVMAPYVITIETSSSTNVGAVANSWTASPPNGRSQWLSCFRFGTNPNFTHSYNVTVGTSPPIQFNADFILQPHVSYSLTAGFTASACNAGGNVITFNNTSSPVLFNNFYCLRAFQGIPQFGILWNYGDTSGTSYAINGIKAYNYRVPYTVKLKDTLYGWWTGCSDEFSDTLDVSPLPPAASSNSPLCNGATLNLKADTIVGANYYWTGPNGYTSTQQNPTVTGVSVSMIGNYNVRAIIGQCSSLVATTYVNVITTPSATNNGPICAGQTLNLSATNISGATYAWTGPNGFTSSSQSPSKPGAGTLDSGLYSVSLTLAGCGTIGPYTTVAVVNRVPGTPTLTNNGPLCVGDNLNLTATSYAGGVYDWIGPNSFSTNQQNPSRPSVQNSFAGTYTVTITSNGCTSLAGSTTVTINNVPAAPTAGNNGPLCSGQSLSLTATAISGATYAWSGPNGFTSTLQNPTRTSLTTSDAGNYSVIATANGCSSAAGTTYVAITTLTPTPVTGSNGPLCPGQNLQLTASSIPGATYAWTGPNSFTSTQQNPTISGVTSVNAGIYSVTATTSGCGTSSAGNVSLLINSLPSAPTAGNNGPVCSGDSLYLSASNVTGASYFWTGPNGFSSSQQNPALPAMNSLKAGIYSVYVTVTGCGTSPTSSTTVVSHATPNIPTALSNAPVCAGDTLKLSAYTTGVGPNATYAWSGANSFNSSLPAPQLLNANTGHIGTYYLTVSDSGCTSQPGSTFVNVKSIPAAPVPSSNAPICENANLLLSSTTVPGATYSWSGPGGYSSNFQNPLVNKAPVTYSGTFTVKSIVNGCSSLPASLTVLINASPATPTVSNDGPKCVGDNVSLSASTVAGATYSWSGPGGFSSALQNPILNNVNTTHTGMYSVITISSTCSSAPGTTNVNINPIPAAPILSTNPVSPVCSNDSLQLFVQSVLGASYYWTGPAGFGSALQNPVVKNLTMANKGLYSATITKSGCVSPSSNIDIDIRIAPSTSAISGSSAVYKNEVKAYSVTGSTGSIFTWNIVGGVQTSGGTTNSISVTWGVPSTTASVKVQETGVSGCKGAQQVLPVTITPNPGIGERPFHAGRVSLFPNPAAKTVSMDFDLVESANAKIEFINILGQSVMGSVQQVKKGQVQFDISELRSGLYFVTVIIGTEEKVIKLRVE